jgi:hypothetical protein
MIRFVDGSPTNVWLFALSNGDAYTYAALAKRDTRPVTYVSVGEHTNYATASWQPYLVPIVGPIADSTGTGALWNVTLNYRAFWFENSTKTFTSAVGAGAGASEQAMEGVSWLSFQGAWGDDTPPTEFLQNEQYCISTEYRYTAGPTGALPFFRLLLPSLICHMQTRSDHEEPQPGHHARERGRLHREEIYLMYFGFLRTVVRLSSRVMMTIHAEPERNSTLLVWPQSGQQWCIDVSEAPTSA